VASVTGFFIENLAMTDRMRGSSLQHLGFAWFAMVMGLCGLSLAWSRAVPHWGAWALTLSQALGWLAAGVFLVLLVGQGVRWFRFPASVREDAFHPVRHVFVAAFPSSLVLLATVWMAHDLKNAWIDALCMLGATGLLLCTVAVLWRWLQPGLLADDFWRGMTPALFIPVVGNVLPALAGLSLGHPAWAAAQYGLAAVLWPVMLVLVLVRIGLIGLWPERMLPVTFITIAPPSVLALSGHQMGAPDALIHMFWGVAAFFTLIALTLLRLCLRQPFGMSFWGMSFPLAAFAALSLHLTPASGVAQWVAGGLLMCVTVVITALLSATLRGLIHGELLRPEGGVSGGISGASKPVDL
jgi:tellurite resistance protein